MSRASKSRTRLTEQELATLIRESTRENYIQGAFGPGWTELLDIPSNAWAEKRVAEMREVAHAE